MKIFYAFWFLFSAGWGYLMSQPLGFEPKTKLQTAAGIPIGAMMTFFLLGIEAWRAAPRSLQAPSIELKPWQMPTGLLQFVLVTFMFSGFWGVVFGAVLPSSDFGEPLFFLLISVGGLGGVIGVHRAFRSRFST